MSLIEIFDLDVLRVTDVENALRAIDGVKTASALRDDRPYVVVECPTEADALRVHNVVAAIDPGALIVPTAEAPGPDSGVVAAVGVAQASLEV